MDRVLKRVGLSKRTPPEGGKQHLQDPATQLDDTKVRRRRRSKSRRRPSQESKKSRGLFHIDWDSVKDCKSCKSRAITKRFCSKRCDNELYRSNSFKFERFIRGHDDTSTLGKKISLCDEYSLPVDHLNKRRPNSIAVPSLFEWQVSSPNDDKIEILEAYSTPRDSKQQQLSQDENEVKCFTSPDREYSQPYTTEGSSEPSSDEEFFGHRLSVTNPLDLNSPDSINEGVVAQVQSPNRVDVKRHPSPYYYSDLYKYKTEGARSPPKAASTVKYKKSQSLDKPDKLTQETESKTANNNNNQLIPKRHTHHHHHHFANQKSKTTSGGGTKKYRKSASLDNPNDHSIRAKFPGTSQLRIYKKSSSVETQSTDSRDAGPCEGSGMPSNRLTSPCDHVLEDDMTRQRHVYETAFDCRISKSDDDLDQIDKVSNHPVLVQVNTPGARPPTEPSTESNTRNSRRNTPKPSQEDNNILALSQELQDMHLEVEDTSGPSGLSLPLRGYTPSPPSTAPLPAKFHGKVLVMNSIRSAPNLPSHPRSRLKDLHLPVKSFRGRSPKTTSSGSAFEIEFGNANQLIAEFKGRPGHSKDQEHIYEIKDRPRKPLKHPKPTTSTALDFKPRRSRRKYSSTESMITSSSGGSMESIKSSTSEGNRSTSSSESRQSSSLSSHSSDSGNNSNYTNSQTTFIPTNNKLHILSPISDKSSQEPVSETSDNNRNNNSQKCSPEEVPTPETIKTKQRRLPQNKNLLNLGLGDPEIQGSDSGISIQSREGVKSRFGFTTAELSAPCQDFSDLPFDMPKLRRRRILPQDACTSGSATSVDLRDLPFDMPKLRRRLRLQPESSVSQASSSQSVQETDKVPFRSKLTLNLGDVGMRPRPGLGLSLVGLGLNLSSETKSQDDGIDVNVPLEKQGWFHGSISRVEAENVLKVLREGSFLVRNSESTKHDYSLSLKSARGFMHMRIQKNSPDGSYILGQFSKPFNSIPEMIRHFSINRLPIRGAEHMCLLQPVIAQLL